MCVLDLGQKKFENSLVIPPASAVSEKTVFLPKHVCEHILKDQHLANFFINVVQARLS